jgi:hypothetical protein
MTLNRLVLLPVDSVGLYGGRFAFWVRRNRTVRAQRGRRTRSGNYHHQDTENTEFKKLNVSENVPFFDPDSVPPLV